MAAEWTASGSPVLSRRPLVGAAALVLLLTGAAAPRSTPAPSHQKSATMGTITSKDGTRIVYSRSGSGPPLVLVHGTTADRTRWVRLLPELEPHFTVYAMDRRGRGGSGDADDYSVEREFHDVAGVVEAIGEPVFLLGHSYGALCALEASLLTDKVRRLILYEPPIPLGEPVYPAGVPERIQALVDAGDLEAALEVFFREVVQMPDQEFEAYRSLPVWQVRIALAPTIPRELVIDRGYRFRPDRFAHFDVPTLLLLGGASPPVFRQVTEMLGAALPASRIAIMPGQQHVAMETVPALFLREVLGFLRSPGSPPN